MPDNTWLVNICQGPYFNGDFAVRILDVGPRMASTDHCAASVPVDRMILIYFSQPKGSIQPTIPTDCCVIFWKFPVSAVMQIALWKMISSKPTAHIQTMLPFCWKYQIYKTPNSGVNNNLVKDFDLYPRLGNYGNQWPRVHPNLGICIISPAFYRMDLLLSRICVSLWHSPPIPYCQQALLACYLLESSFRNSRLTYCPWTYSFLGIIRQYRCILLYCVGFFFFAHVLHKNSLLKRHDNDMLTLHDNLCFTSIMRTSCR